MRPGGKKREKRLENEEGGEQKASIEKSLRCCHSEYRYQTCPKVTERGRCPVLSLSYLKDIQERESILGPAMLQVETRKKKQHLGLLSPSSSSSFSSSSTDGRKSSFTAAATAVLAGGGGCLLGREKEVSRPALWEEGAEDVNCFLFSVCLAFFFAFSSPSATSSSFSFLFFLHCGKKIYTTITYTT